MYKLFNSIHFLNDLSCFLYISRNENICKIILYQDMVQISSSNYKMNLSKREGEPKGVPSGQMTDGHKIIIKISLKYSFIDIFSKFFNICGREPLLM